MEKNFVFTNNWFDRNIPISMKLLQQIFNHKDVNILEIGSHEGKSTTWMLENLCKSPDSRLTSIDPYLTNDTTSPVSSQTYKNFCHNISLCMNKNKFKHYNNLSQHILPKFIEENKQFDIIYVDGSHLEKDVLADLNYSDKLIKKGGVILLDDVGYDWEKPNSIVSALKSFMMNSSGSYQLILKEYQCALQRL